MIYKLSVHVDVPFRGYDAEKHITAAMHTAAQELADMISRHHDCEVTHEVVLVLHPCGCGSGLESEWEYDARGIELCRCCDRCKEVKLAGFRPDVLDNPNYEADEPIEEEP